MNLSIGGRLKSAREAKKLSLEEAVRATKIQKSTLKAVEEDRLDEVLEPAYAKIFLKKYAGYLGMDGQAVVQEWMASSGAPPQESQIRVETEAVRMKEQPPSYHRALLPVGVGLVGLVGIGFLGYLSVELVGTFSKNRPAAPQPARKQVAQAPARKLLVPRSQPLKLTIQTKDKVWMQVKADGSVIFQDVLPKGAKEVWTAKDELELWTGNAGAMELTLNGHDLGSPGQGVRKGIKVTREGLIE